MKKIIYNLWILIFLFGCSESEKVDYSSLSIDFPKSKIEVGENTKLLEIPVILSGCKSDIPLSVSTEIEAIDQSAIAGTDYELISKELTFDACGTAKLLVRILDNKEVTEGTKNFTINLKIKTNAVQTTMGSVSISIINDDVEESGLSGFYTLTLETFLDATKYSSEIGGVEIVEDQEIQGMYHLRKLALINGDQAFPLTLEDDLYLTVDENGNISMPANQNIGDYGEGKGVICSLSQEGNPIFEPIVIRQDGKKLILTTPLAGVTYNKEKELIPYYAFKNVVLEKTDLKKN